MVLHHENKEYDRTIILDFLVMNLLCLMSQKFKDLTERRSWESSRL